jgi:hypothetical protein
MNHATARVAGGLLAMTLSVLPALAPGDEAPIAGTVKAVDGAARTLTVEARAQGKVRQVVIEVRPATRIVRFVREAGGGAFKEQAASLEDLEPGWTVSVTTSHEGTREVAELVRVVHEK